MDISKSQFIAFAGQVETEEQAIRFISSIKQQHPAANHHCTAYITGGHDQLQRADDDGEPSGTAGKPILEVIKKHQFSDTVRIIASFPKNRCGDIMKTLTELTAGQAGFTLLYEVYRDFTPDP